jgi:hypothetical protein
VHLAALRVATYRFRVTFGRRWGGYLAFVLLGHAVAAFPVSVAATTATVVLVRAE